jgi:hypothetical protein
MMKSRRMKLAGHVACMGLKRSAYRDVVRNPERRRLLGRPKYRWEDSKGSGSGLENRD